MFCKVYKQKTRKTYNLGFSDIQYAQIVLVFNNQTGVQLLLEIFQKHSVCSRLVCLECLMGGACSPCDYSIGSIVPVKLSQAQIKYLK